MRRVGRVGYDFFAIRSKDAKVKSTASSATGDDVCGTSNRSAVFTFTQTAPISIRAFPILSAPSEAIGKAKRDGLASQCQSEGMGEKLDEGRN